MFACFYLPKQRIIWDAEVSPLLDEKCSINTTQHLRLNPPPSHTGWIGGGAGTISLNCSTSGPQLLAGRQAVVGGGGVLAGWFHPRGVVCVACLSLLPGITFPPPPPLMSHSCLCWPINILKRTVAQIFWSRVLWGVQHHLEQWFQSFRTFVFMEIISAIRGSADSISSWS
jgi:hypothetical protein